MTQSPQSRLVIFPGPYSGPEESLYRSAYYCWKQVWEEVYKSEMGLERRLHSDEFTRQHQIIALFSGELCAGVAFQRTVDSSSELVREDSFFRFWPRHVLKRLPEGKITLASCFTIHPEFRKGHGEISWKELFLGLYVDHFCENGTQAMITAARKVRSNEKLCQKLGAQVFEANVPYLIDGRPIDTEIADLMIWDRRKTHLSLPLEVLRQSLWNNRTDLTQSIHREKKYAA